MSLITEAVFLAVFIIINIIFLLQIGQFPQEGWDYIGPAAYPRLLLISILVILLILLFNNLRKIYQERKEGDLEINWQGVKNLFKKYKKVLMTLLLFFLYIYVMSYIGFRIATFFYLMITQWYLSAQQKHQLPKIIIASVLISFGISYFFEMFLGVRFPRGALF